MRGPARSLWVFPACAGMFPRRLPCRTRLPRFPRVRGDVPIFPYRILHVAAFSPRARGCSAARPSRVCESVVFPACAGMFPRRRYPCLFPWRFPRVRGDVPCWQVRNCSARVFSPRARGCSQLFPAPRPRASVFPACAGMFRLRLSIWACLRCFPRVRGDVPAFIIILASGLWFSPRARGCS